MDAKNVISMLFFCLLPSFHTSAQSDPVETGKKMGLVSYFTTIKALAELKLLNLESESLSFNTKKDLEIAAERKKQNPSEDIINSLLADKSKHYNNLMKFKGGYIELKLLVDRFINQLSSDMYVKNKVRPYKLLNRFIKKADYNASIRSKLLPYKSAFNDIESLLVAFQLKKFGGGTLGGPGFGEIVGAIELVHTAFSEARAFRQTKVAALAKQLDNCKLKDVKPSEEENETK